MRLKLLAIIVVVLVAVMFVLPSGIDPAVWTPPPPQPLTGAYARNDLLKDIQRFDVGIDQGPAAIALDAVSRIYVGYANGRIIRLENNGSSYVDLSRVGGRPLAMSFDPDGDLAVADTKAGLEHIGALGDPSRYHLKLPSPWHAVTDIERSQREVYVYITDASSKFGPDQQLADQLEHRPSGRLLSLNVHSGASKELLTGLSYPTGVTLGPDEAYVLVSESGASRIVRYWLTGEKAGTHDVFVDNLPGQPGDLSFNGTDRVWVTIPKLRNGTLEALADKPFIRGLIARLPHAVQALLTSGDDAGAFVLGFDPDGKLVANLQYSGSGGFGTISNVEEAGPWLYFGSPKGNAIGRYALHNAIASVPPPLPGSEVVTATPKATERHDEQYAPTDASQLGTAVR